MQTEATEHYGRVENGVAVLEKPEGLADGTYVCVTPVKAESTLGQRLLEFAGTIEGSTSGYGEQPRSLYPRDTEEMTSSWDDEYGTGSRSDLVSHATNVLGH
jgi:hypothetical protein